MGSVLLVLLLVAAGVLATVTDLRVGKIYNRDLICFGAAAAVVYVIFYPQLFPGNPVNLIANAVITVAVSFLLFYTRFWSAGDAKLFCLVAILMPGALYLPNLWFPAFYLLMATFILAFTFALGQSVYYEVMDRRRPSAQRRFVRLTTLNRQRLVDWFLRYFAATLVLGLVYRLLGTLLPGVVGREQGLILITGMILLVVLYSRLKTRRLVGGVIAVALLANAVFILITHGALVSLFDFRGPLIALVTIVVLQFAAKYDQTRVAVSDLKPGMTLSALTILGFRLSGAKGLPQTTTETPASRLSAEQVKNIKAWGALNPANSHVIVVSSLPFAPFVLAGSAAYIVLAYVSWQR